MIVQWYTCHFSCNDTYPKCARKMSSGVKGGLPCYVGPYSLSAACVQVQELSQQAFGVQNTVVKQLR